MYYQIMLCTHRVDYYNEAIPLEYNHTCLAIELTLYRPKNNFLFCLVIWADTLVNRMHSIPCESGAGVMSIQCL